MLLALLTLLPFAQARPLSVERAERSEFRVGDELQLQLKPFDDLLSIDDHILEVVRMDRSTGLVTVRPLRHGTPSILVLRGGLTLTHSFRIVEGTGSQTFRALQLLPADSIPLYQLATAGQVAGSVGGKANVRFTATGSMQYRSEELGLTSDSMVSVLEDTAGLRVQRVRSLTSGRRFDLELGDHNEAFLSRGFNLSQRGIAATIYPGGRDGVVDVGVELGQQRPIACCGLLEPEGLTTAVGRVGLEHDRHRVDVRAGLMVPNAVPGVLPMAGAEYAYTVDKAQLLLGGGRAGAGYIGSAAGNLQHGPARVQMTGLFIGKGSYRVSQGPAEESTASVLGVSQVALSHNARGVARASYRSQFGGAQRFTDWEGVLGVEGGGKGGVGLAYGVGLRSLDGDPADGLRHLARLSAWARPSSRRSFTASLAPVYSAAGWTMSGRMEGRLKMGPVLSMVPNAWVTASARGTTVGLNQRMVWERADTLTQTTLGVVSTGGNGGLKTSAFAQGRVDLRLARWLSTFGSGAFGVPIGKGDATYNLGAGATISGALTGVGGTIGAGGRASGSAFVDLNGNGVRDPDEFGVSGVQVQIVDRQTLTEDGGRFKLRGLLPGVYDVSVTAPGYHLASAAPTVEVFKTKMGRVDLPLVEKKRLEIRLFSDLNDNRQLDLGEWGVGAEVVSVTGQDGATRSLSTTDGRLTVDDVVPGTYVVSVLPALLAEGYIPVDRTEKRIAIGNDGFTRLTFAMAPVRTLRGKVCTDRNRNGRLDGADTCEAGQSVAVAGRTVTSLPNGEFYFGDLAIGSHVVTSGSGSLPIEVTDQPFDKRVTLLRSPDAVAVAVEKVPDRKGPTVVAVRSQVTSQDLKVGERSSLHAEVTYADFSQKRVSATWRVVPNDVVRIEQGRLVALKQGTATLTGSVAGIDAPPVELVVRNLPIVGLTATPYTVALELGEVEPLAVRGIYVNGDADDVTDQVRWETANPDVAKIEGNGVVVAVGPGLTTVRGSFFGVSTAPIEVRVGTGDARPTRLAASPPTLTLGLESTGRVYADGELASGAEVHLTSEVRWETDRADVLTVLPGGRIRPLAVGRAQVWCSFKGVRSTPTTVEVVAGVGLVVVPTLGLVPTGEAVPIQAFQILEDGSFAEIVKVKWQSSNEAIATVEDGLLSVHHMGTAEISARYRGTSSLPVVVEGVPSRLRALEASVDRMLLQVGEHGYLDSQARFSDDRVSTATSVTRWVSSDPAVATVSSDGEVVGVRTGRALVQGSWLDQKTPIIEVIVDAGVAEVPSAVLVEPGAIVLSAQGRQALAASVVARSGRVLPAGAAQWSVGDPSVAWVEDGEVRAVSVGSTTLTARIGDVESLPVQVTVEPIVGVTATPAVGRLPVGARVDLKALAVVADGSIEDLTGTDSVRWTSSDPGVLRIDANGQLLAFAAGTAEVTGQWRNLSTLPIPVEVADVDLESLLIEPEVASMRVNETLPLAVVATFTDGGTTDAAPHVTWTSTRPDVLSVDGGLLAGIEPGVAEVFASWMGVQSAPMRVTVAVANAVGVILGNAAEVMPVGTRAALRATAVTDDGKLLEASEQTTWRVADPSIVRVDANGILKAQAVGATTLFGEVGGERSPAVEVEVTDAAVLRLAIRPGAIAVSPGEPLDVRVVARLEDGRRVDVTSLVKWELDGTGLAADRFNTLTVVPGARGQVRARLLGVRSDWASVVASE